MFKENYFYTVLYKFLNTSMTNRYW